MYLLLDKHAISEDRRRACGSRGEGIDITNGKDWHKPQQFRRSCQRLDNASAAESIKHKILEVLDPPKEQSVLATIQAQC